jgi:hypothetical protein
LIAKKSPVGLEIVSLFYLLFIGASVPMIPKIEAQLTLCESMWTGYYRNDFMEAKHNLLQNDHKTRHAW